jgi:hypothetical protein
MCIYSVTRYTFNGAKNVWRKLVRQMKHTSVIHRNLSVSFAVLETITKE